MTKYEGAKDGVCQYEKAEANMRTDECRKLEAKPKAFLHLARFRRFMIGKAVFKQFGVRLVGSIIVIA